MGSQWITSCTPAFTGGHGGAFDPGTWRSFSSVHQRLDFKCILLMSYYITVHDIAYIRQGTFICLNPAGNSWFAFDNNLPQDIRAAWPTLHGWACKRRRPWRGFIEPGFHNMVGSHLECLYLPSRDDSKIW